MPFFMVKAVDLKSLLPTSDDLNCLCFFFLAQIFSWTKRLYFSLHLQMAWSCSFSPCQFVFCPAELFQQQRCYFICPCAHVDVWWCSFSLMLRCQHFVFQTGCLFSFKWPLCMPKEDFLYSFCFSGWTTPCLVKGMLQFTVTSFCLFVQCCQLVRSFLPDMLSKSVGIKE